jgi:hypothetical protein
MTVVIDDRQVLGMNMIKRAGLRTFQHKVVVYEFYALNLKHYALNFNPDLQIRRITYCAILNVTEARNNTERV